MGGRWRLETEVSFLDYNIWWFGKKRSWESFGYSQLVLEAAFYLFSGIIALSLLEAQQSILFTEAYECCWFTGLPVLWDESTTCSLWKSSIATEHFWPLVISPLRVLTTDIDRFFHKGIICLNRDGLNWYDARFWFSLAQITTTKRKRKWSILLTKNSDSGIVYKV